MVPEAQLKVWFCREVLPLEPVLTRFIRRNWRSSADVLDIRQDVYERVLVGASHGLPVKVGPYLFTVTKNVLINRVRRNKIVSIEFVADLEEVAPDVEWLTPARHVEGREELRRAQKGLDQLPPRCREVVYLRKALGFSTREVAEKLGIGIDAVEQQTSLGTRALVDFMLGGSGRVPRGGNRARIKMKDLP